MLLKTSKPRKSHKSEHESQNLSPVAHVSVGCPPAPPSEVARAKGVRNFCMVDCSFVARGHLISAEISGNVNSKTLP